MLIVEHCPYHPDQAAHLDRMVARSKKEVCEELRLRQTLTVMIEVPYSQII